MDVSAADRRIALIVLLGAAVVLGLAPILVRLGEVGPAAAGMWRFAFSTPLLLILTARPGGEGVGRPSKWMALAGLFFPAAAASSLAVPSAFHLQQHPRLQPALASPLAATTAAAAAAASLQWSGSAAAASASGMPVSGGAAGHAYPAGSPGSLPHALYSFGLAAGLGASGLGGHGGAAGAGFGRSAARHVEPARRGHVGDGDQSPVENLRRHPRKR